MYFWTYGGRIGILRKWDIYTQSRGVWPYTENVTNKGGEQTRRGRNLGVLYEPLAGGVDSRLGPVGNSGLVEYAANVIVYGPWADNKFVGDLSVGVACRDQAQHLDLSLGQSVWVRRPGWRLRIKPIDAFGYLLSQWAHTHLGG
jgi:hypothetical protein